ncbi:MAG: hypothetical protein GTO24_13940 [candidate division Zixibacteria bacterium]|nr:hypothetical protein [candidate division Zixibacteria bacterium]
MRRKSPPFKGIYGIIPPMMTTGFTIDFLKYLRDVLKVIFVVENAVEYQPSLFGG